MVNCESITIITVVCVCWQKVSAIDEWTDVPVSWNVLFDTAITCQETFGIFVPNILADSLGLD